MGRVFRTAILTVCILTAGSAFAAGGACPSGTPVAGSCYFIAASGSDTNNGTSESTPWQHAPGMPLCANNCASNTPIGGSGYIFRGGDTWHMGNSGASPYTGGAWQWQWNGSTGSPIYLGVDTTWHSGGSWARPILTGDNPICSPSSCTGGSYPNVTSCAYHVLPDTGGSSNTLLSMYSVHYVIVDNFEMTGLCEWSLNGAADDSYIRYGAATAVYFYNLYLHGWSHPALGDPGSPIDCGVPNTVCANINLIYGGGAPSSVPDDTFRYVVVDGSDSDPIGIARTCYCDFWDVAYSYIGYQPNVITRWQHSFHDNLYEYWYENGHGNVMESVGDAPGVNAMYNNVFRHINPLNQAGDPGFWPEPPVGTTNYFFNNLNYDWTNMEYFNVGQNSNVGDQGNLVIFNNTFQYNALGMGAGNIIGWVCPQVYAHPLTLANNHYITDGSSAYTTGCSSANSSKTTELLMSNSKAASGGYTSSGTYAYSSTSVGNPTVGTGTNGNTAFCGALSSAGLSDAASACGSDTTYACSYNSASHTVFCPARSTVIRPSSAWDIGGYQYNSGQTSSPAPPSGLSATVQ
jgi:hypothetical protein